MPVATKFNALTRGNGFPACIPNYDVTSGEYVTLGGYKNTDAPTAPTQTQLDDSLRAAMKLYWNLYGFASSPTITGSANASASASSTFTDYIYDSSTGNYDVDSETVSASTSTSKSYTYNSTPVHNVSVPKNRVCQLSDGEVELSYPTQSETTSNFDEDIGDFQTAYVDVSTLFAVGQPSGQGAFLPLHLDNNTTIRKFIHNGVFVGYGLLGTLVKGQSHIFADAFVDDPFVEECQTGGFLNIYISSFKYTGPSGANAINNVITYGGVQFYLSATLLDGTNANDTFSVSGTTINVAYSETNSGSDTTGSEPTPPASYTVIDDSWNLSSSISLSFSIPDLEFYTYS